MQLKNVIIDMEYRELPQFSLTMNEKGTAEESIVLCDDSKRCREWQARGFATLGVENHGRMDGRYVAESIDSLDENYLQMVFCRFHNLPLIIAETKRLIIREMTIEDLPSLYDIYKGEVLHFVEPLYEYEKEMEFTKSYIENMYGFYGYGLWLLVRKEDGRIVGRAGISNRCVNGENEIELGYIIGKEFWRQGYGYEACKVIIQEGFERTSAKRLIACIDKENAPSIEMAQKLGFRKLEMSWDQESMEIYELAEDSLTDNTY